MKIAIYALTPQGAELGRRLSDLLGGDLFVSSSLAGEYGGVPFDRIGEMVSRNFPSYSGHVFIAASGIVVRSIAPLLKSKDQDPAVLVLDQDGNYVISLLSGHLGGANRLAQEVAGLTGGDAVITTATDSLGVPSVDLMAKDRGLTISNPDAVKSVNMAILKEEPVQIFDPENRLGLKAGGDAGFTVVWVERSGEWERADPGIWVTWRRKEPELNQLLLHPSCLIAGIGCNRGTKEQEILDLMGETFLQCDLSLKSLKCLTTIEDKRDERGILEAARELDVPVFYFGRQEISSMEVPNPSGVVKKHMGVSSVCEATALLKSGGGELLAPKTKSENATLAVALENYS